MEPSDVKKPSDVKIGDLFIDECGCTLRITGEADYSPITITDSNGNLVQAIAAPFIVVKTTKRGKEEGYPVGYNGTLFCNHSEVKRTYLFPPCESWK